MDNKNVTVTFLGYTQQKEKESSNSEFFVKNKTYIDKDDDRYFDKAILLNMTDSPLQMKECTVISMEIPFIYEAGFEHAVAE